MDEEKILNLWRWFYANEQKIRESLDNNLKEEQELIVQALDNLVLDLGRFSWDIGEGTSKDWSFTISPNGDKDLLERTKEVVKMAPELAKWEFYYCKQAKKWDRQLQLYDAEYEIRQVDANNWSFGLVKSENGKYDLLVEAKNIKHLDAETANTAINLVVLYEIGEEAKIERVNAVKLGSKPVGKNVRIDELAEILTK